MRNGTTKLQNLIGNMSKKYTKNQNPPLSVPSRLFGCLPYVICAYQVFGNNFLMVGKLCCCLPLIFLLPRCFAAMSSEPRPRYWCSASRVTRCSLHNKNIRRLHDPDSTYHPDADAAPTFTWMQIRIRIQILASK
jgi:hypothetical protein